MLGLRFNTIVMSNKVTSTRLGSNTHYRAVKKSGSILGVVQYMCDLLDHHDRSNMSNILRVMITTKGPPIFAHDTPNINDRAPNACTRLCDKILPLINNKPAPAVI